MHLPKLDLTNFPPQEHTISFDEAVIRTRVWRDSIQKLFGGTDSGRPGAAGDEQAGVDVTGSEGPGAENRTPVKRKIDAPKSIYVDYADLHQLAHDYKKGGIVISGFRLYFTLESNNIDNNYLITGMLVPTVQPVMPPPPGMPPINYDLIIPVPILGSDGTTVSTGTSIYDFTVPCPTFCGGSDDSLTGANETE